MKLSLRGRLFAISLTLMGTVGVAAGLWLQSTLKDIVTEQLQHRLVQATVMGRVALSRLGPSPRAEEVDVLTDQLGAAAGMRITVVAPNGSLLGDSELPLPRVLAAESHAQRPEINDARSYGLGIARRYSTTLSEEMLYVAVPRQPGEEGFIRAAVPLSALKEPIRQFRLQLLPVAGLGLLVSILMSAIASALTLRPLSSLVRRAQALAAQVGRDPSTPEDELGYVAGSLERFSHQLGASMSALAEERDRLDAVLSGMDEGVLALDGDQRVRITNPATHRMLGLRDQAEGRMLVELSRVPGLLELAQQALRQACAAELQLGNQSRTVAVSGTPLRATNGCLLVLRDVTEVRRLEQVRRDFVANISHELRTPVAVIRANSETLLDGAIDDPKAGRTFAAASLRHAERLSNLLSDLLDLAKLESDAYGIELHPLGLQPALAGALASIRSLAEKKRITLSLDVPQVGSVMADAQALDQVLVNLLENAVKYTQDGGHVSLSAITGGPETRIEIRDDGPGVSREHRDRIFERFYRIDAGRSREVGGTGLGLSIVKHLVGAMGGQVGLEANEPQGSCFWLSLRPAESHSQAGESPDDERDESDGDDRTGGDA